MSLKGSPKLEDSNEGGGHTEWSQAVNNLFIQTNLGLSNYSAAGNKECVCVCMCGLVNNIPFLFLVSRLILSIFRGSGSIHAFIVNDIFFVHSFK